VKIVDTTSAAVLYRSSFADLPITTFFSETF
jgi:hypothetical protein